MNTKAFNPPKLGQTTTFDLELEQFSIEWGQFRKPPNERDKENWYMLLKAKMRKRE